MTDPINNQPLLDAISGALDSMRAQLAAGFDVSPAQRLRWEGLTGAAMLVGIDAQILLQFCRARLPADASVVLSANAQVLQLELWQARAPVQPTTSE